MSTSLLTRAAAAAAVATAATLTVAALPATAAVPAATTSPYAVAVSNGSLTWKISECAFSGCRSLTETQSVSGSVTKGTDGWTFTGGKGSFDQLTGATTVDFTGSVSIGNTTQGGYSITFTDPTIAIDTSGNGTLTADLTVKENPAATPTTTKDVLIVALPAVGFGPAWTVTPPWDGVGTPGTPAPVAGRQFAQPLISALPDSLKGWFWATGTTGSNLLKAPAPVTAAIVRDYTPMLVVRPAKGLKVAKETTVTVTGVGYNPALQGKVAQGLYVVFGPNAAKAKDGYTNTGLFGAATYLPTGPDAIGRFTTSLKVKGLYTAKGGTVYNGTKTPLGISTWAAHAHATTAWDAFARILFR